MIINTVPANACFISYAVVAVSSAMQTE